MKWYLKILFVPILFVNLLTALLLLLCAYSPMLPAEYVPLLSLAGLAFPFVLAANVAFFLLWLLLYRPFMLVSLIAFVACVPQIRAFFPLNMAYQNPPAESFKLVSYNILSSNLKSSTANRDNPLVTYLEGCEADIICLQEFPFSALKSKSGKELLADYPYRSYEVSGLSELKSHYLCCLSKYPILSVEKVDLSSTGNGCARYRILHENDTIVVYNCHLQSNNLNAENKTAYEDLLAEPKREKIKAEGTRELVRKLRESAAKRAVQAGIVLAEVQRETSPYVIVCGDFNDSPISFTRKLFTQELIDAYVRSGNGPGFSYNRNKLFYRIDHILHSPAFESYDCTVDRTIKTSDHYPITCYLKKTK